VSLLLLDDMNLLQRRALITTTGKRTVHLLGHPVSLRRAEAEGDRLFLIIGCVWHKLPEETLLPMFSMTILIFAAKYDELRSPSVYADS
jgi:hypothetical protein